MIDNNLIQAAIVAYLKADTALIAYLTTYEAEAEVREAEWQGSVFLYPCVRVELGTQTEEGNPPCYSTLPFTIYSSSEQDSSLQANHLAGLVQDALKGKQLSGTGFTTGRVISDGNVAARRTRNRSGRAGSRVWEATNFYRMNVYGGNFD